MKDILKAFGDRPIVVASLGGGERLVDAARRATKLGADILEIRIDSLSPKERANISSLLEAIKEVTKAPLIGTIRSSKEQDPKNKTSVLDHRERKILFQETIPLVDFIDVEIESDPILEDAIKNAHKAGKQVVLSYHDFKSVPTQDKVNELVKTFHEKSGDILKIAGMPKDSADVLKMFELCRSIKDVQRVMIAMGEIGRISRVAGYMCGSRFTYGYMNKPTAPGQLSVQELVDLCALFYPSFRAALIKK